MFDLHRHDEYSTFDGFGKASELAKLAKELGYNSLCTTNHGNTNGLIQTYQACKDIGIKAILGVEGYFLPKVKEKTRGYHLVLIAKNLKGYGNLNRIQYEGEKQKYYNPIWDFDILKKYHEGVICSTACVAGLLAKYISNDEYEKAKKFILKLKSIFKDDLYIEVQPYKVSEEGLQEKVNLGCIKLGKELGVKCILTSDSHRGRKEEFDTYMKMHEIAGHSFGDIEKTYKERYMPKMDEMKKRFCKMHEKDFGKKECIKLANEMYDALDEIEEKCELNYLDALELKLPKIDNCEDSFDLLLSKVKSGLKKKNVYDKKHLERCKEELKVIKYHGFEDYFLIVADYVNWAKDNGINVGPGRGSVCNSLVAYALNITDVDSLFFNLDFRRFLRKDKKKFPDIDIDFETSRRQEVVEYLCKKYEGHAARICSYGLYKVDNLLNDLSKICGLMNEDENGKKSVNKVELARIKRFVKDCIVDERLDDDALLNSKTGIEINKEYDNILLHFSRLFKKVRFIGTHAAGVAITGGNLLDYVALRLDANGNVYTNYDLIDIEYINVIKFDILGLRTMESIGELRRLTNKKPDYKEMIKDKHLFEMFKSGETDGVFQFEKATAKNILNSIDCDCFEDVVAASSMNRPGPLSLGMPSIYSKNKFNDGEVKSIWWDYTSESYGTIIYQEQVQSICRNLANMSWEDADKIMKFMKGSNTTEKALQLQEQYRDELLGKFKKGVKNKMTSKQAENLFDDMTCYTFNKGHAVGYSLISLEEMWFKAYYPNEFWASKLRYANKEDVEKYKTFAVRSGAIILLPHINGVAKFGLVNEMGSVCLQEGLCNIDFVGEKVAIEIENERKKNGDFKSYADLVNRIPKRMLNNRVLNALENAGAIEFDRNKYLSRVELYNMSLYGRNWRQ